MFKSMSIKVLTWLITALVTCINFALLLIYVVIDNRTEFAYTLPIAFIIIALFNIIIIRSILEQFVFRRLKVIYKIISENKLSKLEKENIDLSTKSLEEVRDDVVQMTASTQREIATLKSLEQYRKDYVGNLNHELKTPLFSIGGYIHTLLDGGLYDEKINMKYLQKAASNIDRLQEIVDDLGTINKLESDQMKLNQVEFGIKDLIDECIIDTELMADQKRITISYKAKAATNFKVFADREAIRKVMNNLLTNSIKYGNEGGHTKVSLYRVDDQCLIEVTDDGMGIEDKHLKHLFDRFYRIDSNRSRKIGGSGLGLSIVKHLLEAHKQTINVRSTPGIGTTFGFTLDMKK